MKMVQKIDQKVFWVNPFQTAQDFTHLLDEPVWTLPTRPFSDFYKKYNIMSK